MLFITTLIARLSGIVFDEKRDGMGLSIFFMTMPPMIDHLLNSIVMYWFLFENADEDFLSGEIKKRTEMHQHVFSIDMDESWSRAISEGETWVGLSGTHPVKLDWAYIHEH